MCFASRTQKEFSLVSIALLSEGGPAMEVESSLPLVEAFQGEEFDSEGEEEWEELEEDMVSCLKIVIE